MWKSNMQIHIRKLHILKSQLHMWKTSTWLFFTSDLQFHMKVTCSHGKVFHMWKCKFDFYMWLFSHSACESENLMCSFKCKKPLHVELQVHMWGWNNVIPLTCEEMVLTCCSSNVSAGGIIVTTSKRPKCVTWERFAGLSRNSGKNKTFPGRLMDHIQLVTWFCCIKHSAC